MLHAFEHMSVIVARFRMTLHRRACRTITYISLVLYNLCVLSWSLPLVLDPRVTASYHELPRVTASYHELPRVTTSYHVIWNTMNIGHRP